MQSLAAFYARQFNAYNPPKKVDFVKAWVCELTEREGHPMYVCMDMCVYMCVCVYAHLCVCLCMCVCV